ncbi:uncharacterized protein BYT42DRAFT_563965 [Radiomyces spectabilis]|uniref:uncharacterized protein n=1 Tax=Radiomyces spectabilis TaxID=64574 RepID=UPI00221F6DAA|nr:uncharacterized protein BYT42DRAFT_563965 [Radiomyces spectabilis]KAI8384889.1 hypothetical protein BYT42DRAFT_563965 [Radiomyces spectabilis]
MSADAKLIVSLINRIVVRLPSHRGEASQTLENDPLIQQTVATLIDLSEYRLPLITNTLITIIDSISKPSTPNPDEVVAPDVLESQYLLLKILSACMQHHWQCVRALHDVSGSISGHSENQGSDAKDTLTDRADPPPLDDTIAKYVVSAMSRFMFHMSSMTEKEIYDLHPSLSQVALDIYKASSRIIFYVSASNWPVVFARIKARLLYLSTTDDEDPDTFDVQLLECCALNARRLSMLLAEFGSLFPKLKAQLSVAAVLRRTIWNWIEAYPMEFTRLYRFKKRMEGNPDLLFDICGSLADSTKRKAAFWPLQLHLLLLCPDILASLTQSSHADGYTKKAAFISNLRKEIAGRRYTEIAAVCYIDVCRAVTYMPKEDGAILFQQFVDVEKQLQDKLFNLQDPLFGDHFPTVSGLLADARSVLPACLAALFRCNPLLVVKEFYSLCFDERAPKTYKPSFVKASLILATDVNRYRWMSQVQDFYFHFAHPLRRLLLLTVNQESEKNDSQSSLHGSLHGSSLSRKTMTFIPDKKTKKEPYHNAMEQQELLVDLLRIFQMRPMLAFVEIGEDKAEHTARLLTTVAYLLRDKRSSIRRAAADCLLELHNAQFMTQWTATDALMMPTFWRISSQVVTIVAKQLLDHIDTSDQLKLLLKLLYGLSAQRQVFLRSHEEMAAPDITKKEWLQSMHLLETCFLLLLCSTEADIFDTTMLCLQAFCEEAARAKYEGDIYVPFLSNLAMYQELVQGIPAIAGCKLRQKFIRKLLREKTEYSTSVLAAWAQAWHLWKQLTTTIIRPMDTHSRNDTHHRDHSRKLHSNRHERSRSFAAPPRRVPVETLKAADRPLEWQNYGGLLASLAGICFLEDATSLSTWSSNESYHPPHRSLPQSAEGDAVMNQFIREMVELLTCDNLIVREWIKDILGTDLSSTLSPTLFKQLEDAVSACFHNETDSNPIRNPRYTLLVDQTISILRLLLQRIHTEDMQVLYTLDFSPLVTRCAAYLNDLAHTPALVKIKIKMCQLCELLLMHRNNIMLGHEFSVRNKLLDILVKWISEFAVTKNPYTLDGAMLHVEDMQRELDLLCLKTLAMLLHHLPIMSAEDSMFETDSKQIQSRAFYEYYMIFYKLLNRYRIPQNERALDSYDASSMSQKELIDLNALRKYTILALSNLLSANIDNGLSYVFSACYHSDTSIRVAFVTILTSMIRQGVLSQTSSHLVNTDRFAKLVDILVDSDIEIVLSLCDVCPISDHEDAVNVLLATFASRNKVLALLKAVIEKEVQKTDCETDLFRKTNVTTRLLSRFAKMYGGDYVRSVLGPVFKSMDDTPREQRTFELDPSKLGLTEDVAVNKQNVIRTTEMFLNAICASTQEAPKSFRQICHYIATAVSARFSEATYTAVGAFIFLRFFCPAIVSPEELAKCPRRRDNHRGYLMITKVIQNLANNVLFGSKETYMIALNDFLTYNIYRVTNFLREISDIRSLEDPDSDTVPVTTLTDGDHVVLHRVLYDNFERIRMDLGARRMQVARTSQCSLAWKHQFDQFANILVQIGRPSEAAKKEANGLRNYGLAATNQLYADFMRRHTHRSTKEIVVQKIFYDSGLSRAGRPVFYVIARRIVASSMDFDLLIFHILKTLEAVANRQFEILFDMSQYDYEHEIPGQWIERFMHLMPLETVDSLTAIYVYNPSTILATVLKKHAVFYPAKIVKRLISLVTLTELYEYISPPEVRLPKSTINLDAERGVVFFPVSRLTQSKTQNPVTIKVGLEYVQVTSARKQEFVPGFSAITNDVYHISEINDLALQPTHSSSEVSQEFRFRYGKNNHRLVFGSLKAQPIVNAIKASKQRLGSSTTAHEMQRTVYPKEIPGRLLSIALLMLGHKEAQLRVEAYHLLYTLAQTFNLNISRRLLDANDICVPANNTDFLLDISKTLATEEPWLTLDFLDESLVGFYHSDDSNRYLALDCVLPWFLNLPQYLKSTESDAERAKERIHTLIKMTAYRGKSYKLMQTKLWRMIAKMDNMFHIVLDAAISYSVQQPLGSDRIEAVADTIVSLSNTAIHGQIISRIREVLHRTMEKPSRTLTEHPVWMEIVVLLRFLLMLSFNNEELATSYLPEIFHIVTLTMGLGSVFVRATVHGILINVVQSLCTGVTLPESNRKRLQLLLNELSESRFQLLFGIKSTHVNAFTVNSETLAELKETVALTSLEMVIMNFMDVMASGALTTDVANIWRARWMSLVTSTVFHFNPAIQPRAFVILGCLGQEQVDDDLLYQILVALRGALDIYDESNPQLVVGIIVCLKDIVPSLSARSKYLRQLFWVAVSLLMIESFSFFRLAVEMLTAVLGTLNSCGSFTSDVGMAAVLLAARTPIAVARELDQQAGVNFESYFSFAIAGILLKGVRNQNVRDSVYEALSLMVDIDYKCELCARPQALGYIGGLMPGEFSSRSFERLFQASTMNYDILDMTDETTALLLFIILVNQLDLVSTEGERLRIYEFLAEAAATKPSVFATVYELLLPKMNHLVANCQKQALLTSVQSILVTACSENEIFKQAPDLGKTVKELGFSGLAYLSNAPTNSSQHLRQFTLLASRIIENIIAQ